MNGDVYEEVDTCHSTGKPYMAPIAWHGKNRIPGKPGGRGPEYERKDRPISSTCSCCPEQVTMQYIDERNKKNRKRSR